MHTLAVQLAPILGAEKSKVPFYVAGGVLVAWALVLALGIGLRRADFPADIVQQRVVMAISAALVLGAVSTAVITSGGETKNEAAAAPAQTVTVQREAGATTPTATSGAPTTSTKAGTPAAHTSLKLAAKPTGELSYNTKTLSAKAGSVTIALTNASPVEHNVTIAQGSKVLVATPTFTGGSRSVTAKLPPGTYTFYCSVPGHRQAGMEGTLTVS
jgi:plastocyanin